LLHCSPIAHPGSRLPIPVEIRPHVGAALAASLADKAIFNIGQPHIVGQALPLIAIEWLQLWSAQYTRMPRTPISRTRRR
jgi:hypothetical protein